MPNWKKLIVSGSDAALNTLQITGTPTGTTETDILVSDASGNIKKRSDLDLQGEKGQKGQTGSKGQKGQTGSKGQKGEVGATGSKGNTGSKGQKGQTGSKGQTGPT